MELVSFENIEGESQLKVIVVAAAVINVNQKNGTFRIEGYIADGSVIDIIRQFGLERIVGVDDCDVPGTDA